LDILHSEAKDGMLDPDLLEAFIQGRVYESVLAERRASTPNSSRLVTL
jgi:hypothetical protein